MKSHLIFLALVISAACVHSLSVRSAMDTLGSLFHWKTTSEDDQEKDCTVNRFSSVDKIDTTRLSGDWYEIGRTITMMPIFYSGLWRFNSESNPDQDAFLFTGKAQNGKCIGPIRGSAISSNTNPGTFVLAYDGLKSKVEEELKVIYVDYDNVLVLYGCRRLTSTGTCLQDATFVAVLSRKRDESLPSSVLNPVYDAIRSICIDPHTLSTQDTTKACKFEEMDGIEWKEAFPDGKWPVCQNPAACTIACPRCCNLDQEGCISCDCGLKETMNSSPSNCKKDVSECDHSGCILTEKSPGCMTCDCTFRMAAQGMPYDNEITKVDSYDGCPQSCRIHKTDDQLYCNCTNERICRKNDIPHVNCKGNEERYAFDVETATCPAYLGQCEDAINSFSTVRDCLTTCLDVCELHPVVGSCREHLNRFFYNRVQGKCTTFVYGGCEGNENNFPTLEECQQRCPTRDLDFQLDKLPALCHLKESKGTCQENHLRYFFVPEANTCVQFHYSGCGGNDNNFETIEDCNAICKPKFHAPKVCKTITNCECLIEIDADGCPDCDCDSAVSPSISVNTFLAFIIFMWLAN